jgi:hypothetical protein
MKTVTVVCALSLLLMVGQAWAQKLAPGLWENTSTMKDQSAEGAARMEITQSGRWLGAACGDVKPLPMPPPPGGPGAATKPPARP